MAMRVVAKVERPPHGFRRELTHEQGLTATGPRPFDDRHAHAPEGTDGHFGHAGDWTAWRSGWRQNSGNTERSDTPRSRAHQSGENFSTKMVKTSTKRHAPPALEHRK